MADVDKYNGISQASALAEPRPPLPTAIRPQLVGPQGRAGWSREIWQTLRLAAPLALTQIGQLAMFTTDLMLIGRLGAGPLAAAAIAHTILFTVFIAGMGLTAAVAPLTAQAVGAGDAQRIRRSLRVGLHTTLMIAAPFILFLCTCEPLLRLLGQSPEVSAEAAHYLLALSWSVLPAWLFLTFRSYMSALEVPGPGLWIMLAGVAVNIPLAYVLIFGWGGFAGMGMIGAGVATTFVNAVMAVAAAIVVGIHPMLAAHKPFQRFWRPDWEQLGKLLRIGLPITVTLLMEHSLFAAATLMAGSLGIVALASHQIAIQIASIVFMVPMGFGLAASVRVGERFGAGDLAGAKRAGLVANGLGIAATVATTLVVLATHDQIPAMFLGVRTPENAETFALASTLLIFASAFFVVDGMQTITAGLLRGYSDTKVPMILSTISFWAIGFPAVWLLTYYTDWGVRGIWIGLSIGLATYAGLLLWRFAGKPRG